MTFKSIFDFVSLCCPLVEVVDGMRVVDMNARNVAQLVWFVNFLIDEVVVEVDVGGIYLGVGIIDAFHASPVECAQAHGARLAAAVDDASIELKVATDCAGAANGVDLGMCSGVVIERDRVAASGNDLTVFDDDCSEWATSAVDVLAGDVASHLNELAVFFCDGDRFHNNSINVFLIS